MAAVATLVFCAPGSPGDADSAQPLVDAFAKATATGAGWKDGTLAAVYDPSEQSGVAKLGGADSVLTFVPFPFYVQRGAQLHLAALAQADVVGVGTQQRWTLVGKTGAVTDAASLAGYTILSTAGYAPDFVRHSALGAWALPADVKIESTGQILSALRRVTAGEHVVALLDQTEAASLPSLPFAAQLKTLVQSPPLPVALVALVDARLPPPRAKAVQAALIKMSSIPAAADALSGLQLKGFVQPRLPTDKP
jgi:hypothetical protein